MLDGVAVPALGPDGWIKDPGKALDRLLSYAFESDKSQTYSYGDNVTSIAYDYALNNNDPEGMARAIQSNLEAMLLRYYPYATVSCRSQQDTDNENKFILRLAVQVTDNQGKKIDLDKVIKGNNAKITEIIDYLNG